MMISTILLCAWKCASSITYRNFSFYFSHSFLIISDFTDIFLLITCIALIFTVYSHLYNISLSMCLTFNSMHLISDLMHIDFIYLSYHASPFSSFPHLSVQPLVFHLRLILIFLTIVLTFYFPYLIIDKRHCLKFFDLSFLLSISPFGNTLYALAACSHQLQYFCRYFSGTCRYNFVDYFKPLQMMNDTSQNDNLTSQWSSLIKFVRATFSLEAYAAYSKQCPTRLSRENPKCI